MGARDVVTKPDAVLLMAYGSPATLGDVEAYYTHIRGGRTPSPEKVEELCDRYRMGCFVSGQVIT